MGDGFAVLELAISITRSKLEYTNIQYSIIICNKVYL